MYLIKVLLKSIMLQPGIFNCDMINGLGGMLYVKRKVTQKNEKENNPFGYSYICYYICDTVDNYRNRVAKYDETRKGVFGFVYSGRG